MAKKNFKSGFEGLLGIEEGSYRDSPQYNSKNLSSMPNQDIEKKATFVVNAHQMDLIKSIAFSERKMVKTILFEAFEKYIENYKEQGGEIRLPNK